jgi:microcystin-dependent protein
MEPFLGQVCLFSFSIIPRGWAPCNGQLMAIAQNTALFALIGTTYGGDGITTFALPDLRGRAALNAGHGPGLSSRIMGEASGTENVTLISTQMPAHNHPMMVSATPATSNTPNGNVLAVSNGSVPSLEASASVNTYGTQINGMANPQTIGLSGGSQPHYNMQPYLVMNYCIATSGIFPSQG